MAQGLTNGSRRCSRCLAKAQKGGFMRQNELENTRQKAGFARCLPDRTGVDAGDCKETWQKFGVRCYETEGAYRQSLGVLAH